MTRRFTLAFALVAIAGGAFVVGCARVASPLAGNLGGTGGNDAPDLAAGDTPDLGGPGDDNSGAADLATGPTGHDLATPDLATPPDFAVAPGSCHVVVNEVMTGTTQTLTEEFVEIFNPCSGAVTVDGWKLVYRAATNTGDATTANDSSALYTFAGSIPAGGYRLLGGSGYTATKDGTLASGIAASGAVAMRNAGGAIVDSVAWGTISTGNAFVEGAAAIAPTTAASPGHSIERLPNGSDSDHNSTDFAAASTPTPGAANH